MYVLGACAYVLYGKFEYPYSKAIRMFRIMMCYRELVLLSYFI